jgi:thiamine pyrophosphate-dependent acetolactate synthase large subunit-like protein
MDERHPLALGAGCGTTTYPAYKWLGESDVLLVLGASLTRSPYAQPVPPRWVAPALSPKTLW